MSSSQTLHQQVFLYYGNLVGYLRVALLLLAFYHSRTWTWFISLYASSFLLDMMDGAVARAFQQTSRFGAAMDIFTDKMSTPGLLLTLSHMCGMLEFALTCTRYPDWTFCFTVILILDVSSHYFHFYCTLLYGVISQYVDHLQIDINILNLYHKEVTPYSKNIDESKKKHIYWLIIWFYGKRWFFGFCCLGYEAFLVFVYAYYFLRYDWLYYLVWITLPSFCCKNAVHVAQLLSSVDDIAKWDWEHKTHLEHPIPDSWIARNRAWYHARNQKKE